MVGSLSSIKLEDVNILFRPDLPSIREICIYEEIFLNISWIKKFCIEKQINS